MVDYAQVELKLQYRQPFRWAAITAFLSARAIDGLDSFAENRYERNVEGSKVAIRNGEGELGLHFPKTLNHRGTEFVERARRMFDLDAAPAVIDAHLSRDRKLRPLLSQRPGVRVPGAWEPFEVAVRAIVGQQISVRGATTIMQRLASVLTPERLAEAEIGGMPRSRAEAIRGLARAVADDPNFFTRPESLEEAVERLTSLRGIGPWTAHYVAMRTLGQTDAFPHSDLGLKKAAAAIGIDPSRLVEHAERWRPYRAYAAIALWESLGTVA